VIFIKKRFGRREATRTIPPCPPPFAINGRN
jgi:hypothetical protein